MLDDVLDEDDVAGDGPGRICLPCHGMPTRLNKRGFIMGVEDAAGNVSAYNV